MGIGHRVCRRAPGGLPLRRAGRTGRQLPLVAKEGVEVAVVPRDRCGGPGTFEPRGDRVVAVAGAEGVLPAEAHLLEGGRLGLWTHVGIRGCGTVTLAERVSAGDERDGLHVIHGHAPERLADVARRGQWVGYAVGTLGVDVDEAHLHCAERILEHAVTGVAIVRQPLLLRAPVGLVGLPHVGATATEAEGLEAHALERGIAGQDEEIRPRELAAVLRLDRPQQAAGLVEVGVVRPAVERREALQALAGAAATIAHAVGAGAVPRHADEEGAVVAVVRGPPLLRVRHEGVQVRLDRREVKRLELLGVVEVLPHGVGLRGVLLEHEQVELLRPPVLVLRANAGTRRHRALALVRHVFSSGCMAVHGAGSLRSC